MTERAGSFSFILCLEALHLFLGSLIWAGHSWGIDIVLASPTLDWRAWVVSGAISGIASWCVFHGRSMVLSSMSAVPFLGSLLVAVSDMAESPRVSSSLEAWGAFLIVAGVVTAIGFQLKDCEKLFNIPARYGAALFLSSLLSPLLIMTMRLLGSILLAMESTSHRIPFNTVSLIERVQMWLYPCTVATFALLTTQPFWLPVLADYTKSLRADSEARTVGEISSKRWKLPYRQLLLVPAVALGVVVSSYRLIMGYPLTGDAEYYLSALQEMDHFGVAYALATDRPLLFLIFHLTRACLAIEAKALLSYLQIALTAAFTVSTYLFTSSCLKDRRLAVLSAILVSISPHITFGIRYFIVSNWLALVLLMLFYTAMLKSSERRSRMWAIVAIALSWVTFGLHFPTWIFATLVLIGYCFASWRQADQPSKARELFAVRIALGSLCAVVPALFISLVVPEASGSFQGVWFRTASYIARLSPLNFARFLQDEVQLSGYFGLGIYAIPLIYALSLVGLYRLYHMRESAVRLVLSWMAVVSFSILVIPNPEQCRILYMMPIEILAAGGLLQLLGLVSPLRDDCGLCAGDEGWLRGIALTVGLLASGAVQFAMPMSNLLVVSGSVIGGWFLSCDVGHGQVLQIAAIQASSLFVLGGAIHVLYSLS